VQCQLLARHSLCCGIPSLSAQQTSINRTDRSKTNSDQRHRAIPPKKRPRRSGASPRRNAETTSEGSAGRACRSARPAGRPVLGSASAGRASGSVARPAVGHLGRPADSAGRLGLGCSGSLTYSLDILPTPMTTALRQHRSWRQSGHRRSRPLYRLMTQADIDQHLMLQ